MAQQGVLERSETSSGSRLARWLFIGIIVINILAGTGVWALSTFRIAKAAAADLQHRITLAEASLGLGVVLDPGKRAALQSNLDGMHSDVVQLEGLIPFGSGLGPTTSMYHALRMVDDLLAVGQHALVIGGILGPSFQALVGSISHPVAATAPASAGALSDNAIAEAQSQLQQAQAAWQSAMAERKGISQGDLNLLPIKSVGTYLQMLDKAAPVVDRAFTLGLTLVPQLHALLGVKSTEQWLLFDMDSDELRPTGGFLGNYGLISILHGALTSRISLHDVYTLDCPNDVCPARALPSAFSWFLAGAGHFGLRDSNLDPDLPRSAVLMERMFQLDGGPKIDGVVLITPALVAHLLDVTGPLYISQFQETITSANLRDKLHYYHQNPQIAERLGISAAALGTTKFKVFDVLLSRALIAKFSGLTQAELGKLLTVFGQSLQTKDVQVFSNNPQLEDALQQLGVAEEVKTAPDSLFVVDTNDQGSYANADVREGYVDHVTLDAKLGAQHSLTITYDYTSPSHSYQINPNYTDFVRIIVPANAIHATTSGDCTRVGAQEPDHAVLGCRMILPVGQRRQLTFTWYTPYTMPSQQSPASAVRGPSHPPYQLLIQRQAGAVLSATVIVSAPAGMTIVSTAANTLSASVLRTSTSVPGASIVNGEAQWTASPFVVSTQLAASVGSA